MAKLILVQFLVLFFLTASSHSAQSAQDRKWEKKDMDPKGLSKTNMRKLERRKLLPGKSSCGETECTYDLFYFVGDGFKAGDSSRKNILYVPGGPGEIVDRQRRELDFLEQKHNVVYFDVRGTGLSLIPEPNRHDKFLRAGFIASDIEELRRGVLGEDKAWDAIYAHSYGTIVAQHYAALPNAKVKKLVLSAPVSRHQNLEPHRRRQIVSNLDNIYKHYTSAPDCKWKGPIDFLMNVFGDLAAEAAAMSATFFDRTNDFCFLKESQIDKIKKALTAKLEGFDEHGAIGFVLANHEKLAREDKTFKKNYPYPERFFLALKQLEFFGSPAQKSSDFPAGIKNMQVDAALILGYYLMADGEDADKKECNDLGPFWSGLKKPFVNFGEVYCVRVQRAGKDLESPKEPRLRSVRANRVLSVYDGLSQWVFSLLKNRVVDNCLKGKDINDFASDASTTNKVARELLRRVGIVSSEVLCRWNPRDHSHGIPTLILKGGADAVIAGCQAEDFAKSGVTNERGVLIEFPGLGHVLTRGLGSERQKILGTLLEKFLELSATEFRQSADVNKILKNLHAVDRTPASGAAPGC